MRIAFLCGGLGLGGVADYTRLLAGALRAHGIESLIIGLADRDASAILRDATAEAPRCSAERGHAGQATRSRRQVVQILGQAVELDVG